MKQTTLCLLLKENEILLAMKKRGFGMGRWNGVGGKVDEGESIKQAALREMEEEIGVTANHEHLVSVGTLNFYFPHKPKWDQCVNLFVLRSWNGEPKESDEMKPVWHAHHKIPYNEMWPDDKHWLPMVLAGKKIEGEFYFADDGDTFERFDLREI